MTESSKLYYENFCGKIIPSQRTAANWSCIRTKNRDDSTLIAPPVLTFRLPASCASQIHVPAPPMLVHSGIWITEINVAREINVPGPLSIKRSINQIAYSDSGSINFHLKVSIILLLFTEAKWFWLSKLSINIGKLSNIIAKLLINRF